MAQLHSIEVWLHQEEIEALDQACELLGFCDVGSHYRFIRRCLQFGLLSLRDDGLLKFPDAATPEFVRQYDAGEAAFLAADSSQTPESADSD